VTHRHDTATTLAWMRNGTAHLAHYVEKLDDDAFRRPSRLPGWTRAHVVGHVARNADALTRLATWARTGVETPMYADRAQRAAEIDASASLPARVVRAQLASTAAELAAALDALTRAQWKAPVRSALGRSIPAAEIPWMRVREVWLHAIDLGTGATPADLPPGVVDLLLDEVTTTLSGKDGCPSGELAPTDRDTNWWLGSTPARRTIAAPAAELAGWLTGRLSRTDLPALPTWL
jgi:maleylpyruvate isomerase